MKKTSLKRVGALALAVPILVAGCSTGTDTDNSNAAMTDIVWVSAAGNISVGHMDPHASQLAISGQYNRQIFDSLVWLNDDGEIVPWLATDWTVSEDGKTYVFQLREDVTFHDGEHFDAAAAVANFEHITDEGTASAKALDYIGGELFKEATATGEYELTLTLEEPFTPLLANLSTAYIGMYSPKSLAEHSQKDRKMGAPGIQVGSGPFILTEFTMNQQLVLEANPDYNWPPESFTHSGPSSVKTLTIRIVPEEASRIASLKSNEAQIAVDISPDGITQLESDLAIHSVPDAGMPFSAYLNTSRGAFQEEAVRQAFMYGINIDENVEAAFGGAYQRAWSILSPTLAPYYDADFEHAWEYNPEKASQLLAEAGWETFGPDGIRVKNGERLTLEWLSWLPYSDQKFALVNFIAEDMKKIGVEVQHQAVEGADYQQRYWTSEDGFIMDFEITDWAFDSLDADALRNHLHTNGYQNASRVSDTTVDQLLEQAASSTDVQERAELYHQIQQWNMEHVAIVPIYMSEVVTAYHPDMKGLIWDAAGWPVFYGVTN